MNVLTAIYLAVLGDIRSCQKYPLLCWRISHDHRHSKVIRELFHSTKPFHGKRYSASNLGQDKIMFEF